MRLTKHYRVFGALAFIVLTSCGGSGDQSGSVPSRHDIVSLASIASNGGYSLTSANGRVYFIDYNYHKVQSVPVDGGVVVTHLEMFESFWPVRHSGNNLYMVGRWGLYSIPDSTVGATTATPFWSAAFEVEPAWLSLDDTNLYWITNDYDVTTTSITTHVYSQPLDGGATQHLGTIAGGHAMRMTQSGNYLFIATTSASGGGIFVMPKAGGTATPVITTTVGGPSGMWIKGDLLYFYFYGLYSYNLLTGDLATIWESGVDPTYTVMTGELYVDNTYIYWTEANRSNGTGAVRRVPFVSGSVETLYTGDWCWDITGDTTSIYWASGRSILKTIK